MATGRSLFSLGSSIHSRKVLHSTGRQVITSSPSKPPLLCVLLCRSLATQPYVLLLTAPTHPALSTEIKVAKAYAHIGDPLVNHHRSDFFATKKFLYIFFPGLPYRTIPPFSFFSLNSLSILLWLRCTSAAALFHSSSLQIVVSPTLLSCATASTPPSPFELICLHRSAKSSILRTYLFCTQNQLPTGNH